MDDPNYWFDDLRILIHSFHLIVVIHSNYFFVVLLVVIENTFQLLARIDVLPLHI